MIVVLPFCNKDATVAAKNIDWMRELDGRTSYRCMLAYPDDTEREFVDRVTASAARTFSDVHVFTYPDTDDKTWPAGPNWSWQSVARYIPMITDSKGNSFPFPKIYPAGEPWLWLEADAVPMKPGWLDTLAEEYKKGGKPFMGHVVKDMGHMNGVGIYPNDVCQYATKPFMVQYAAWDAALKEETAELTHNANHLIQHCWVLNGDTPCHNGGDGTGVVATFRDVGRMLRIIDQNAVLFHRCKDGSLIDCLMQWRIPKVADVMASGAVQPLESEPAQTAKRKVYQNTEIFVVTYHKDAEFLKYCLYSIKKFASGFTGVTVVAPDRDIEIIEPICREWGPDNISIETFTEIEGKGMLHHMALECMADQFGSADFFLHIDSDCIFIEPVTPADYFVENKPVLLMESYDRFKDKHPGVLRWKDGTEKALGREVNYEFMRRHPAVHYRDTYRKTREMVEKHHNIPFLDWAVSGQNEYPQSWSDYNLLGAVAWIRGRSKYHWVNLANMLPPRDKIVQFWSHGGLDRPTDTGVFVPETPRNIIRKILEV